MLRTNTSVTIPIDTYDTYRYIRYLLRYTIPMDTYDTAPIDTYDTCRYIRYLLIHTIPIDTYNTYRYIQTVSIPSVYEVTIRTDTFDTIFVVTHETILIQFLYRLFYILFYIHE